MLPTGLRAIKMQLVSKAVTLVHAMADIISSTGGSEKGGRLK
jgi:pre-mRNA-splicing helicase BRR2